MIRITEQIIAKAGLSPEEAKVIRTIHGLPTAGRRTKRWVAALSMKKYSKFLGSAQEKLEKSIER